MALFKILLFFLAFIPNSWASFSCITEPKRSALVYTTNKSEQWEIIEFNFEQSNFIPSYFSCASFLNQIRTSFLIHSLTKDDSFQRLLTFNDSKAARVTGSLRKELYKVCLDFKGCSLRAPFSFFYWTKESDNTKEYFKDSHPQCLSEGKVAKETRQVAKPQDIFTPLETFDIANRKIIDEFFKMMDSAKWDKVYISTMTFSPDFLDRIVERTKGNQVKVELIFSFGFQSLIKNFPSYLYNLPKNIRLHPVFLSPNAQTSFHIKGALFLGAEPRYLFFTGNFRNYDEETFSDLAMIAKVKSPQLIEDYFKSQIAFNCQDQNYAICSLESRFEGNSSSKDLLNNLLNQSCQMIHLPSKETVLAFGPRYQDMKRMIHDFISKAKQSIKIEVHQINDPEMIKLLELKASKGVKIDVIQGLTGTKSIPISSFITENPLNKQFHSKFIIVDDRQILWSTGNFTQTSYSNPWEMTYLMDDPLVVRSFISNFFLHQQSIRNAKKTE